MKTIIKLDDFFKKAGIDWKEDMYNAIYSDYRTYSIDDIVYNLPKKYENITAEMIKKDDDLFSSLNRALNRADEQALVDAAYEKQRDAVEEHANNMVSYINQVSDEYGKEVKALNSITIDWEKWQAIIDFNAKNAVHCIREIINGEGMFGFESDTELVQSYDGKMLWGRCVEHHLHYFLNIRLIDDIYGMTGKPRFDWDVQYGNIDKEYLLECIEEELDEYLRTAKKNVEDTAIVVNHNTELVSQMIEGGVSA